MSRIINKLKVVFLHEYFLTLVAVCLVMALSYKASVMDWPYTDPKGSLLTGQAVIENGSFDLQPYSGKMRDFNWQLIRDGETVYYAYPVGTTIIHLPGIWVARQLGLDLANQKTEADLNRLFAAISLGIITFLTIALFRHRCSYPLSLFFALAIILGSGVFSTLGLALWNLNYAVVSALAILVMLDNQNLREKPDVGWFIGFFLFLGFICRPSFALFVLTVFAYLAWFNWRQLWRAAFLSGLLLILYLLLYYATIGQVNAPKYSLDQFAFRPEMLVNFLGLLISPSRGLFIFSPFLLLSIFGLFRYGRRSDAGPLPVFAALWILSLLAFISGWFMWWGGGGFGNRLIVETMPGWIFLSAVFWPLFWNESSIGLRKSIRIILPVLAVITFWMHVIQGGNNQKTVTWFQHPNKDANPEYFWNPRFPQWLASEKQIMKMDAYHEARLREEASKGQ